MSSSVRNVNVIVFAISYFVLSFTLCAKTSQRFTAPFLAAAPAASPVGKKGAALPSAAPTSKKLTKKIKTIIRNHSLRFSAGLYTNAPVP
jgi:hypothetical protein